MGGGASKSNTQATEGSPAKGTKSSFISTRQLPVHTSEEVNQIIGGAMLRSKGATTQHYTSCISTWRLHMQI